VRALRGAAEIVRSHHERPDGLGYPLGLKSPRCRSGARILNVADAFDAMTSDRPYRRALTLESALVRARARRRHPVRRRGGGLPHAPPRAGHFALLPSPSSEDLLLLRIRPCGARLMRYRDAGVDIARSDAIKQRIVRRARPPGARACAPLERGFAGVMEWPAGTRLVAATMDGVGTKLHLALAPDGSRDAAADLVYHGANDLLVHGAAARVPRLHRPGALDPEWCSRWSRAEPRVPRGGRGAARRRDRRDARHLPAGRDRRRGLHARGDRGRARARRQRRARRRPAAGLASSGLHTNGYSLARRVLGDVRARARAPLPGGGATTRRCAARAAPLVRPGAAPALEAGRVRALAHVTGGGIAGNLERVLPPGARARVELALACAPLFRWLIAAGEIPREDARRRSTSGSE
jgi:phosphoribosylformylglycinamidine cyclo-ligase